MSITTGAQDGVRVTSAAKESTGSASVLGSQTSAAVNEIIVPDALNSNNEGNLESSPSYVGRLVEIRENSTSIDTVAVDSGGTGYAVDDVLTDNGSGATAARRARFIVTSVASGVVDGIKLHEAGDAGSPAVTIGRDVGEYSVEGAATARATTGGSGSGATVDVTFKFLDEYRYVTADSSNTLTVHEDWIDGPAVDLNWRISYIIQDAATVNGLNLINKRLSDYSSSRRFTVLGGGWIAFLNGVSLESVDNSDEVEADFIISSGGRFDSGYKTGGVPVSGAYIIGTPAVADELTMDVQRRDTIDNIRSRFFDFFLTNVEDTGVWMYGPVESELSKWFRCYTFDTGGNPNGVTQADFLDLRMEWDQQGGRNAFTFGQHANYAEDVLMIGGVYGLGFSDNPSGLSGFGDDDPYTGRIRNPVFVNNTRQVFMPFVSGPSGFMACIMINPIWPEPDLTNQEDITFMGGGNDGSGYQINKGKLFEAYDIDFTIVDDALAPVTDATVHITEADINDAVLAGTSEIGYFAENITVQTPPYFVLEHAYPTSSDVNGKFKAIAMRRRFFDQLLSGGQSFTDGTNGIDRNDVSTTVVSYDRNDGGSFITDGFAVGNSLRVSDTANVAYLGTFTINTVAAGTLTCDDPTNYVRNGFTADVSITIAEVDVGVENWGTYGFKAYKYGKVPFLFGVASLTENQVFPVTMQDDDAITEANQATAITNGSGIIVERHPTPVRGPFNAQVATASGDASTIDLASYAIPASLNDAILIVVVSCEDDTNNTTVTGVDFGPGVDALTQADEESTTGDDDIHMSVWYLINPANATRTIRATFADATAAERIIKAFYITNAAQSTPVDQTTSQAVNDAQNNSLEITPTVTESMAFGCFRIEDTSGAGKETFADPVLCRTPGTNSVGGGVDKIDDGIAFQTGIQGVWSKVLRTTDAAEFWFQQSADAQDQGISILTNFEPSGDTQPIKVFNYDTGTGTVPTVGETITVDNAGADTTGILVEYIGDAVSGTLVLSGWNGTEPENNVSISGSSSSFAADSHISGGGSFNEEYTWLVDCDSEAMTVVYDYLLAKLAESGTSLDIEFKDVIVWGEGEHAQMVFASTTGYFTERNVNRAEGIWLANRGAGTIDYMTSDGGVQFVPPVEIAVTFSGLRDNTEVRVYAEDDPATELAGVEAATDGSADNRSVTFSITASTVVDIRFAHGIAADGNRYTVPDRNSILSFTWPATATTIPITQVRDRTFNNP